VRDHIDDINRSLEKRKSNYPIDELLKLDEEWRSLRTGLQELQAKRNKASLEISQLKKQANGSWDGIEADIDSRIAEISKIKKGIEVIEAELPSYEARIDDLLWNLPNVLDESVPFGFDDSKNVEVRKWGKIRQPKERRNHEDVLVGLGLLNMEDAARVSGARFYYLKGDLALLEQSLIRFALDELAGKGYTAVSPPLMLRRNAYKGVTAVGDFQDALYRATDTKEVENVETAERMGDDLFLIATSEHAIAAMHAGKTFAAKELPLKYAGVSPCFRREAGAHGKDTKGIFRSHQFYKVEQFIFCDQEGSAGYFEELLKNSEALYQKLEIPYRVVDICTGDMGSVAAKKVDLEAYMPMQERYREVVSCSNCTDWQSLRLDIKYDYAGERKYVHTLNCTGIAVGRTIVAIVENYLNDDGTIRVPEALVPYMGKRVIGN
jgi:seryl-tRNA synthetase